MLANASVLRPRALDLSWDPIARGVANLAESSLLEELMWADFSCCEIDDEGLEQFLQRVTAPKLHDLDLGGTNYLLTVRRPH